MIWIKRDLNDKGFRGLNFRDSVNAYNEEEFQSHVLDKTQQFRNQVKKYLQKNITTSKIAGLAFVSLPLGTATRIIDLGGGAGLDFFISRELFGANIEWTCLETEAMCDVVKRRNFKEENLKFQTLSDFLDRTEKGPYPFSLYANSSLQYMFNPLAVLESLLLKKPEKVAIIRTPFVVRGEKIEILQTSIMGKNGPQLDNIISNENEISIHARIELLSNVKKILEENNFQVTCENIQDGSFTRKKRIPLFVGSTVKTVDILARRID